jgi:penicillin-binding protein 1A
VRLLSKIFRFITLGLVLAGFLAFVGGGLIGYLYYNRINKDLPRYEALKNYRPKAVTTIRADDGTPIAETYDEHGRRYPVKIGAIPLRLRNAFLAAEDASFYSHPGIDPVSILRATIKNIMNQRAKQGASTITQQTVKSLLLTREKSMERKIKEAILSYRLENYLTKDEIFEIYLNEIFLGNNSYGVKAAAKAHFHKSLEELTLAECAFMAGLPQRPSELINPNNREEALRRQRYVLDQMKRHNLISVEEFDQATKEKTVVYKSEEQTIFAAPYFASHVINVELPRVFSKLNTPMTPVNPGGFDVYTSVNLRATELATKALQRGVREVDKRRGWRGVVPVQQRDALLTLTDNILSAEDLDPMGIYPAKVLGVSTDGSGFNVKVGALEGIVDPKLSSWITGPTKLRTDDVIEVSLSEVGKNGLIRFKIDQTPELQGAFMLSDVATGEVKAMIGGYSFGGLKREVFNRVTQARRQPGSSFKPFVYLAALEKLGFSPATIVHDEPLSLDAGNGQIWSPRNFDGKFLGPITLRTALQKSRNLVSVELLRQAGVQRVIDSAKKLGITAPIAPNLSIALGSAEVSMFELVRAYGVFAGGGWLADPLLVERVVDRDGVTTVYEAGPTGKQVVEEDTAFIMAQMLRGVVERGTATLLKGLNRPFGGKTGTTNEQMDTWFIGFTPRWVGGVWIGFDLKKTIGRMETGGKAAAPVMLYFMQEFLKDTPVDEFPIPDGVVTMPIDLESGQLAGSDNPRAFWEFFKLGTEPSEAVEVVYENEAEGSQADETLGF